MWNIICNDSPFHYAARNPQQMSTACQAILLRTQTEVSLIMKKTTECILSARMFLRLAGAVAGILFLCLPAGTDAAWARDDHSGALTLHKMTVIGTRRHVHAVTDTPAPVDIIPGEDLTDQGTGDISNLLRTMVPSYNVGTQPISDAATFVRPANMRGLAADQSLVFINGKRRHRAAVITFLGNGVSAGAQGPDISVIPAIAVERVEILRDSASAQYGSDAIAGVMNFVLKDRPEGGLVETQWGQTYEGDGAEYRTAFNIGVPVTESGFANLSAEWREAGPTVRSVQRDDAAGLIAGGNTHVRQPYAQVWGQPEISDDIKIFLNSGLEVSEALEFYAFGNIARRESEGGFFFRNPNSRDDTFKNPKTGNRMVGDLDPDDGISCPTDIKITENDFFDGAAFNKANPGCFVFNERFPGGFTPSFKGKVNDKAATAGFRGSFDSGFTYDTSYTVGRNRVDFSIRNTVNASLGPETPVQFDLGSYVQTEHTLNADLTYPLNVPLFASPLYVATGAEWRKEEFKVLPGEEDSWVIGPLAKDDFGVGANGFSGFSDEISGKWDRSNTAVYIDLETDVLEHLTLATMGRLEDYNDFGSTKDGKIAALYKVVPGLGLRGSVSTGFRAPTVGQQNIQNVTTAFLDGALRQNATLPPTCPEARQFGAKPLKPEESLTLAGGFVVESELLSFTADYFNIKVEDRLGKSKEQTLESPVQNGCVKAGDVRKVSYFGNGFDTRTQGVDLSASLSISRLAPFLGQGETEIVFAGNWTDTEVTSHDPDFLDEKRILQLEEALPDYRFNMTLRHEREQWNGFVRLNYFGSYTETHVDNLDLLIHAGDEVTLDAEMSYVLMKRVELSVGAENIFNNFPDRNPHAGVAGSKYPESSPMGFAGGFYYARLRYFM